MADEPMAPISRGYIDSRIRELGFDSLASYLAARSDRSYVQLGEELDTVPLHIYILQFEEAKATGEIRAAVIDSYVRQINRYFSDGWRIDEESEFDRASALSLPRSDALSVARLDQFEEQIRAVGQCLRDIDIPEGWRPISTDDPMLIDAFNRGWPNENNP